MIQFRGNALVGVMAGIISLLIALFIILLVKNLGIGALIVLIGVPTSVYSIYLMIMMHNELFKKERK